MPADEPTTDPYDVAEWRDAAKQAQWDSLNAYGDLLARVAPEGWARRLADLNMRYYEEVLKGSQALSDQWFEAIERSVPPQPGEPTQRPSRAQGPRRLPMSLHAGVGDTAKGSISLRNKESDETEISFLISDLTSSDGESIRPEIAVLPERFRLGPLEERAVALEIVLDPENFPPGKIFRGTVAVHGYDNLELSLTVWSDG